MSTRHALQGIGTHLEESMGVRAIASRPFLSPTPQTKDTGRRPARQFGRLAIGQLIPDPEQPRTEFSEDALSRLALSIKEQGQLSPVRARWSAEHDKWIIVCGERRWRAALQAGLAEIDCFFHEDDLKPSEILEQQLIENCLREDLQPVEEARAFTALMELNHWNGKEVAEALRIPPSRVSRALGLLRLPQDLQDHVNAGVVPARSAYELSRLDDPQQQRELAKQAAAGKLKHDQVVKAVRQRKGKPMPSRGTKQTFMTEDGWKVIVSSARKGNYHEIEQALLIALEEVRHRISCGLQLF